jgi:hypothetical protein
MGWVQQLKRAAMALGYIGCGMGVDAAGSSCIELISRSGKSCADGESEFEVRQARELAGLE